MRFGCKDYSYGGLQQEHEGVKSPETLTGFQGQAAGQWGRLQIGGKEHNRRITVTMKLREISNASANDAI